MRSGIARHAVSLIVLLTAFSAAAQVAPATDAPTGTLTKIRDSGQIVLGYRPGAMPFSYVNRRGEPIGYTIDLCREIVADVAAALADADIRIVFEPVAATDRFAQLAGGKIDLECSATTDTPERRRDVAFSPTIFIAGAQLLVRRTSAIGTWRDLAGRTVVATAGSSTAAAMARFLTEQKLDARLVTKPDAAQSFRLLASGGADALVTNDVRLRGLIATAPGGQDFHVVGGLLTENPYAIAFRRDDPAFAAVIEASFGRMAREGLLVDFYRRWFTRRLPTGERLDLPIGRQLQEDFRGLGEAD